MSEVQRLNPGLDKKMADFSGVSRISIDPSADPLFPDADLGQLHQMCRDRRIWGRSDSDFDMLDFDDDLKDVVGDVSALNTKLRSSFTCPEERDLSLNFFDGVVHFGECDPSQPVYLLVHPEYGWDGITFFNDKMMEVMKNRQCVVFLSNENLVTLAKKGFFDDIPRGIKSIIVTKDCDPTPYSLTDDEVVELLSTTYSGSKYVVGGQEIYLLEDEGVNTVGGCVHGLVYLKDRLDGVVFDEGLIGVWDVEETFLKAAEVRGEVLAHFRKIGVEVVDLG